jgi:4-hydroxy-tetrahydrodipicolinate reductase
MKIAIIGYGKMGKAIEAIGKEHEFVLKIDKDNRHELTAEALQAADVAIEFTEPDSAVDNILLCLEAGIPVISGTTGWLQRRNEVEDALKKHKGAFLYASNFSIGVNLFFALNRQLASWMEAQGQYDVDMEEIHHTEKKDAPSGTAITLAEGILEQMSRKNSWINEPSADEAKIGIISRRIDKTPGTHRVRYFSPIDEIEIKHTAHSREGFARGALLAAEWIIGKKGLFGMQDVLQL